MGEIVSHLAVAVANIIFRVTLPLFCVALRQYSIELPLFFEDSYWLSPLLWYSATILHGIPVDYSMEIPVLLKEFLLTTIVVWNYPHFVWKSSCSSRHSYGQPPFVWNYHCSLWKSYGKPPLLRGPLSPFYMAHIDGSKIWNMYQCGLGDDHRISGNSSGTRINVTSDVTTVRVYLMENPDIDAEGRK